MADNENKAKCSDGRTFLIAFLTAVIVVAIYHLGMGLCREYCCKEKQMCPPPMMQGCPMMQQGPCFILVPVMNAEQCPMMREMMHQRNFHGGRGNHHAWGGRHMDGTRGMRCGMKGPKGPDCMPCPEMKKGPKNPEKKPAPKEVPAPAPAE